MREHKQLKGRQTTKIKEIGDALRAAGYLTIDTQAEALGLGRSTAWTVLRADHKSSGLTAAVVDRMLAAPMLPPPVRDKLLEYVAEKSAGLYGHCLKQRHQFLRKLSFRFMPARQERSHNQCS
jgi:hypothetical protein